MDDNLPPSEAIASGLSGISILSIDGPDAIRFAQAQFMSDVTSLADGQWQWSGWLTPKGRLFALFALLRLDADTLWLLVLDADPEGLRQALQRFVFRSKVTLAVRDDLHVAGRFAAPDAASAARLQLGGDGTVELDMGSAHVARSLHIDVAEVALDPGVAARWRMADLAHGLPRLDASQSGQWTPQQLSLDRLRAYSVKKGCYPGQEIVARTHFLGQAKRGLALFDADAAVASGCEVLDGEHTAGTVVSCAASDGRWLALAVLSLESCAKPLSADGIALRPRAMLDGLAR